MSIILFTLHSLFLTQPINQKHIQLHCNLIKTSTYSFYVGKTRQSQSLYIKCKIESLNFLDLQIEKLTCPQEANISASFSSVT